MGMLGQYIDELDAARGASTPQAIDVAATLAQWESLDFAERRALVEQRVSRIVVTDNQVEVFT